MSRDVVILVPGLWLPYWSLAFLKRGLRRCGFEVRLFRYHTVRRSFYENALRLDAFIAALGAQRVHLVGHSLGGVLIRALLHYFPQQPPGRVVTLGSPHQGSAAGVQFARTAFGRRLLGRCIADVIEGVPQSWSWPQRECGSLAGNRPLGLGGLITPGLPRPHDGTVTVAETRLPGSVDHIVVATTHFSMLVSPQVLAQVCRFLRSGRFYR